MQYGHFLTYAILNCPISDLYFPKNKINDTITENFNYKKTLFLAKL